MIKKKRLKTGHMKKMYFSMIFLSICIFSALAYAQTIKILTGGSLSAGDRAKMDSIRPKFSFDEKAPPPEPDYWSPDAWAAFPDRQDASDIAPPNTKYTATQVNAPVDVFFIHPTSDTSAECWNIPINDKEAADGVASSLAYCASAFNAAAKIYAPRYRQASLYSFFDDKTDSGIKAAELAYSDVECAFLHYMKFYNHGRPFIIAGHSQGSGHGLRLLQEKIIGAPLARRLVAAYLIGGPVLRDMKGVRVSRSATDTGVIIGWNTYTRDSDPDFFANSCVTWYAGSYQRVNNRRILQINPLSWRLGGMQVPAARNPGSLPLTKDLETSDSLAPLVPKVCGADASGKVLIINKPTAPGFECEIEIPGITLFNTASGDYHCLDYTLFYESIRKNALDRVHAFLARGKNNNDKK